MALRVIIDPDRATLLELANILRIPLTELRTGSRHARPSAIAEWIELRAQILERVRLLADAYRNA